MAHPHNFDHKTLRANVALLTPWKRNGIDADYITGPIVDDLSMPKLGDNRRITGDRVRIPNAPIISADGGNYSADLRDISVYGLGVEYFVMLNFLEVTPQRYSSSWISDWTWSYCQWTGLRACRDVNSQVGWKSWWHIYFLAWKITWSSRLKARVVWTYLNRLGLEFLGPLERYLLGFSEDY